MSVFPPPRRWLLVCQAWAAEWRRADTCCTRQVHIAAGPVRAPCLWDRDHTRTARAEDADRRPHMRVLNVSGARPCVSLVFAQIQWVRQFASSQCFNDCCACCEFEFCVLCRVDEWSLLLPPTHKLSIFTGSGHRMGMREYQLHPSHYCGHETRLIQIAHRAFTIATTHDLLVLTMPTFAVACTLRMSHGARHARSE